MKHIPFFCALLCSLAPLLAEPYQFKVVEKNGAQVIYRTTTNGPLTPDRIVDTLPNESVRGRKAGRFQLPYALEEKGVINAEQFGTGKYYDPNYFFCVDLLGFKTVNERKALGLNKFTHWSVRDEHRKQMVNGDGMHYWTENGLLDMRSWPKFYMTDLQTFVSNVWSKVPTMGRGDFQCYDLWVMNIEQLNFFDPGPCAPGKPLPGYKSPGYATDWDQYKNNTITLETTGEKMTVEQLALRGYDTWYGEFQVRRANRYQLLQLICKEVSKPGSKVSFGSPRYTPYPYVQRQNKDDAFLDGFCNVSHVGGDAEGNITLKKPDGSEWHIRLHGDAYSPEDITDLYYYPSEMDTDPKDFDEIWNKHKPGTQTEEYIFSKIKPIHIVGIEKAIHQLNQQRNLLRDGVKKPIFRQIEPFYEANWIWPFADVQHAERFPGVYDTPKLWYPPYQQYARYAVSRFLAGSTPGWGFYIFPIAHNEITTDTKNTTNAEVRKYWNFKMHGITSLFQARADMQPYESFYPGSTLIEDPDVQINQQGDYASYTGTEAVNNNGGVIGVPKPAFMLRYKTVPGGKRVLILGGMLQDWTAESTHNVRIVDKALNGNYFKVKVRGPGVFVYDFFVKDGDTNQVYEASPISAPQWEKPGYSGRVRTIADPL